MQAEIIFLGTPAKVFRLWYPYAPKDAQVVVSLDYQGVPNRKFTWTPTTMHTEPLNVKTKGVPNRKFTWTPTAMRIDALKVKPKVGDGSGHGAYYWDQATTTVWVKVKGGESVEVRTDSAITVSSNLALDINTFYDQQDSFMANLASFLGIDPSRIKIVSIVPGSVVLDYLLYDDPALSAAPIAEVVSFVPAGGVSLDPEDAFKINQMTPAEKSAALADAISTSATMVVDPITGEDDDDDNKTGALIGIIVGCVVGVLAIAGLAAYVMIAKRRRAAGPTAPKDAKQSDSTSVSTPEAESPGVVRGLASWGGSVSGSMASITGRKSGKVAPSPSTSMVNTDDIAMQASGGSVLVSPSAQASVSRILDSADRASEPATLKAAELSGAPPTEGRPHSHSQPGFSPNASPTGPRSRAPSPSGLNKSLTRETSNLAPRLSSRLSTASNARADDSGSPRGTGPVRSPAGDLSAGIAEGTKPPVDTLQKEQPGSTASEAVAQARAALAKAKAAGSATPSPRASATPSPRASASSSPAASADAGPASPESLGPTPLPPRKLDSLTPEVYTKGVAVPAGPPDISLPTTAEGDPQGGPDAPEGEAARSPAELDRESKERVNKPRPKLADLFRVPFLLSAFL
eukprot:gene8884-3762_t